MYIETYDKATGSNYNFQSINIKSIILSDTVNFSIDLTGFKYNNLFDSQQQVPISFNPKSIGTFNATITIKSDHYSDYILTLTEGMEYKKYFLCNFRQQPINAAGGFAYALAVLGLRRRRVVRKRLCAAPCSTHSFFARLRAQKLRRLPAPLHDIG